MSCNVFGIVAACITMRNIADKTIFFRSSLQIEISDRHLQFGPAFQFILIKLHGNELEWMNERVSERERGWRERCGRERERNRMKEVENEENEVHSGRKWVEVRKEQNWHKWIMVVTMVDTKPWKILLNHQFYRMLVCVVLYRDLSMGNQNIVQLHCFPSRFPLCPCLSLYLSIALPTSASLFSRIYYVLAWYPVPHSQ